MGLQKQVLVNMLLIATGTIRSLGAVAALYLFAGTIQVYFTWQIVASIITSISFFIAIWASLPESEINPRFNLSILRDIWKYAAALSANALIGVILSQLDKVMLTKLLPLKQFSYYSVASTAASVIWLITVPFSNAVFPTLVQMFEKKQHDALVANFHKMSQVLALILFPISAVFIIFSKNILMAWLHDPIVVENASLIMALLVTGTMLNGIAIFPADNSMAFGFPQLITYTNLIQSAVIIPLIIFLVNWLNGVGAGIAYIILNSVYIFFMIPYFFSKYLQKEKYKWYLQDVGLPLIMAFAVCKALSLFIIASNDRLITLVQIALAGVITLVATSLVLPYVRIAVTQKLLTIKRNFN